MENEIKQLHEEFKQYIDYAYALIQKCQSDYDEAEKIKRENEEIKSKVMNFVQSITDIRG